MKRNPFSMVTSLRVQIVAVMLALGTPLVAGCATDITGVEAHRLVERGARLLDVRSREEFADHHIDGSLNIPIENLKARLGELPRNRTLIVYCHTGARASAALVILRKAGFASLRNMGSFTRWTEAHRARPPALF